MDISSTVYFSILTDHKAGQIATVNAELLQRDISLEAIWGFGTSHGAAQIIVIPSQPDEFRKAAKKLKWSIREGGCFRLVGEDKTGALVDILKKIASEKLNIMALDAVAVDGKFGCFLLASDEDHSAIAQVLGLRVALM